MARRRGFFKKAKRYARFAKKAYRKSSTSSNFTVMDAVGAFGYGAARPAIAGLIAPVTKMLPFGQYNDEAGLGLLSLAALKMGSGAVRKAGRIGVTVELASLGGQTVGPMLSSLGNKVTNVASSYADAWN